jgi:hypothetical protein
MRRIKSIPIAVTAVALSAGAVLGYAALPAASTPGLTNATEHSGRTVPARPAAVDTAPTVTDDEAVNATGPEAEDAAAPEAEDAPDAATHGTSVSEVAKAPDSTPDDNHGADVSAAAKVNHGQEVSAAHKPGDAGKPADAGKPEKPGHP